MSVRIDLLVEEDKAVVLFLDDVVQHFKVDLGNVISGLSLSDSDSKYIIYNALYHLSIQSLKFCNVLA